MSHCPGMATIWAILLMCSACQGVDVNNSPGQPPRSQVKNPGYEYSGASEEPRMSAKVLQMVAAKSAAEGFQRTVETVEASVNFTIRSIANEDDSDRLCQIDLPNQEGAQGRLCRAYMAPEHVDGLIEIGRASCR